MEVSYEVDNKNPETIINIKALSLQIASGTSGHVILNKADLVIQKGKKFGLIGRNGQGKTTLLNAILQGHIPSFIKPFGLAQTLPTGDHSIFQEMVDANINYLDWLKEREHFESKKQQLEMAMENIDTIRHEDYSTDGNIEDYEDWLSKQEIELEEKGDYLRERALTDGFYMIEKRVKKILTGMGFTDCQKSVNSFSGGWRMRLGLAKLLFLEPTFLLLDEPTNHLDLHAISWLSHYLQTLDKVTLVIVTHNMDFLNTIVDSLLEIDQGQLTLYRGNYDKYLKQKTHEFQLKVKQFNKDKKKMKKTEARVARPRETRVRLEIDTDTTNQQYEISLKEVYYQYDSECTSPKFYYPSFSCKTNEKVVIVGDNGSGKSTLLKLIMGKLEPQNGSGTIGCDSQFTTDPRIKFGYLSQFYEDILDYSKTPVSFVQEKWTGLCEQDIRKQLSLVSLPPNRHHQQISTLSGGEKTRVIFAYLAFLQPNFIIFDEPTNNLDLYTIKTLSELINTLECGVLLVTHDTYLVRELDDYRLYICEKENENGNNIGTCIEFNGNIDDYLEEYLEELESESD